MTRTGRASQLRVGESSGYFAHSYIGDGESLKKNEREREREMDCLVCGYVGDFVANVDNLMYEWLTYKNWSLKSFCDIDHQ